MNVSLNKCLYLAVILIRDWTIVFFAFENEKNKLEAWLVASTTHYPLIRLNYGPKR